MSNGLIDDDADGSDISCFGRSKNKATAGDDGEAEAEPSKSKHQVKQPFSKDTASCNNIGSNWKEPENMNYWHYTFLTFHYLKAGFRRIFCKKKPTTYRFELSDLFSDRVIFVPHGICEPVFAQTISVKQFSPQYNSLLNECAGFDQFQKRRLWFRFGGAHSYPIQ